LLFSFLLNLMWQWRSYRARAVAYVSAMELRHESETAPRRPARRILREARLRHAPWRAAAYSGSVAMVAVTSLLAMAEIEGSALSIRWPISTTPASLSHGRLCVAIRTYLLRIFQPQCLRGRFGFF
jgi:hypothetical protein